MILIPMNEEFTLEKMPEYSFRVKNGVLQGRTNEDFTWYDVITFTLDDIRNGKLGCLECYQG